MFKIKIDAKAGAAQLKVAPPLVDVLLYVYNQIPSLQFEVTRDDSERTIELEGDRFLFKVAVSQGFQQLGSVSYKRNNHRGEEKLTYTVCCDNIQKKRGNRNAVVTEHARTAAKKIIEFFKPKDLDVLGKSVYEEAHSLLRNIYWQADREVRYAYNRQDEVNVKAIGFVVDTVDSDGSTPVEIPKVLKDIVTDKLRDAWHTFDIIYSVYDAFNTQNAVAIKQMRDGSYLLVNKVIHKVASFPTQHFPSREEVVQPYMDKISMLQFTEVNQAVRGVGIRMKYDQEYLYIIVNGDILTDS
jgi:hypothetical protein